MPRAIHIDHARDAKVLLVEDDIELAAELVEGVTNAGIDITSASSAADALRTLERDQRYRIVVTDIVLGDISGLEFLRKLSKLSSAAHLRAIVLSGHSNIDYVLNALRLGVIDFLPKPVVAAELVDAITRGLQRMEEANLPELTTGDATELLLMARKKRDAIFGTELFEDPAWNMILDLYSSTLHGRKVTVTDLCVASGSPPTTALRRLSTLSNLGLIERVPDRADRRRILVTPTEAGRRAMDEFAEWLRDSVVHQRIA